MSKTLLTLRNDVRHYLDESAEADWKDTDLTRIVNKHYQRVVTAVMDTYENYYITEAKATTIADQQEYSLPSDFFKVRRVELTWDVSDPSSQPSRCLPVDLDAVRMNLGRTDLGYSVVVNPAYYLQGNIIGFIPIPAYNGTNAIKIWYIKQISDLVEDTNTIDIPYPDRYYAIITKAAAAEALRKGQQEPMEAQRLENEAKSDLETLKRELEDRVAEEAKMVIDTTTDPLDFGGNLL